MKNVVSVSFKQPYVGPSVREFSEEVHGENFRALAEEFAATNNGVIIKDAEIISEEAPKARKSKAKAPAADVVEEEAADVDAESATN